MVKAGDRAEDAEHASRPPRLTGSGRRRRIALLLAALVGVPLGLALVATLIIVAMALSGWSIDASPWRDAAALRASTALGRPVVLQGVLELKPTLSRELAVQIGGLRILNPPGFSEQEFVTIGELRVRVDLIEALRGRLRSSSIEASDVALRLERGADGTDNWTSPPQSDSGRQQPAIDIARIVLRGLEAHYYDSGSATRRSLKVDELTGSIGTDRPLRLAARGRLEPGLDYSLALDGGPLRLLQDEAENWPFTFEVSAQSARLHADGAISALQRTARVQVEARAENPALIERLVGSPLPGFGASQARCTVTVAAATVNISDLQVRLGESELSGQLSLALGGARPRFSGALRAATLDLRPFLAAPTPAESQRPAAEARSEQALPVRRLTAVDAEVDLKIDKWLGPSVDIRDTSLAWRADERGVRIPISVTVAGVPLAGGLELDTAAPTPALAMHLGVDNAELGGLAQGFGLGDGVDGTAGRVRLRIAGRGDTTASLARNLEVSLALAAARLRFAGAARATPIAVSIDALELAARGVDRLHGHARGSLQGERAKLRFRGGALPDMLRDRVLPLELDLALARARLRVIGTLAFADPTRDTALRFDFQAPRAGDLARWLSVSPQSNLPVVARGDVRLSNGARTLSTTLEVGRSQLTVNARTVAAGRPRLVASLRSARIHAQELSTLRAGSDVNGGGRTRSPATALSASSDLANADIDIQVQRLQLGRTDVEDLAFVARSRDGRLLPSALTGKVAGTPFAATLDLDLRAPQPAGNLALSTGAIDIGALLRGLGVAEDIDGQVQALQVNLRGHGGSPSEWARHSEFDMRAYGGNLVVSGAARSTIAEIHLDEARIGALAGEPVRARLDGGIGQTPLTVEVTSGTLADFAADAGHVPFALAAQAAGAQLALNGAASLPLGSGGQLNFEMRGERLDSLSTLARVELPAWGPWSFSSPIHMTPVGYELPSLHARVGGSQLDGAVALDLSGPRPHLYLQVAAPTIQLDDFPLPERLTDSPRTIEEERGLRRSASQLVGRTDRLLSAAFLRRLDATIDVKAKEVLSGNDRLADGSMRLKLAGGHLSLDPAVVNLPGGTVRLSMSYDLKETEVELALAAHVERFDYGIIARRIDRAQDLRGLLSLDLDVVGRAPTLETILHNASGRVDFAVWPTELSGGVFNFWSVNLLLQVVPLIDTDTRPTVNCIVGRFDLDNGDLRDDKMLIDTSTVRIRGAGHANLATEQLEFVFRPRAKGFRLFLLQNPLHVTGKLGDQRFGFKRRDTVQSVLRQIASPILVPIEFLTLGPLPRDGADVCTDPLRVEVH
ncbi:MAG TPA: AsmA family protein [Burkholderiaceae bacterium]|nr:AsmA family protein [Burkholderiaceae bacterium]